MVSRISLILCVCRVRYNAIDNGSQICRFTTQAQAHIIKLASFCHNFQMIWAFYFSFYYYLAAHFQAIA